MGALLLTERQLMQSTELKFVRIDGQHCQEILTELGLHPCSSLSQAFRYFWTGLLYKDQRLTCIRKAHGLLTKWLENKGGVQ